MAAELNLQHINLEMILDSLTDGVYVTDLERRIVYWNRAAEAITGWPREDMVGHTCFEDRLCHVDKDGHQLCGQNLCPLHRSIVTGEASSVPMIVFARGKDGRRVPMQVSVSPIRDAGGKTVGGVEIFRDLTLAISDLERAKRIQADAMGLNHLPPDPRVRFDCHYLPSDIVGGDFYIVEQVEPGLYAFMLADVMGHGIPSALYTMQLRALWNQHLHLLREPRAFIEEMNRHLYALVSGENAFATTLFGLFHSASRTLRLVGAGCPPFFLFRADGPSEIIESCGLPLGMAEEIEFDEMTLTLAPGDTLLAFTDGATEIFDGRQVQLGKEGLLAMLCELGYPQSALPFNELVEDLLNFSGNIRFDDDVTLLEMRVL